MATAPRLPDVSEALARRGVSVAQVALAWLLHQKAVSSVIHFASATGNTYTCLTRLRMPNTHILHELPCGLRTCHGSAQRIDLPGTTAVIVGSRTRVASCCT